MIYCFTIDGFLLDERCLFLPRSAVLLLAMDMERGKTRLVGGPCLLSVGESLKRDGQAIT